MELRTLHILVANMRHGDATSQHTFDLVRLFRNRGVTVQIFHNYPNGPLPDDIQPHVQQADYAQYRPGAELTILQYPVWFPLAERFRQVPGASIFWYHGVTPPALWGARPGLEMVQTAEVRTELAWHAHLAVAASPFTADELHGHSSYPRNRIRVVPLTIDVDTLAQLNSPTCAINGTPRANEFCSMWGALRATNALTCSFVPWPNCNARISCSWWWVILP